MNSALEPKQQSQVNAELYLDLLKKCLTRTMFPETYRPILVRPSIKDRPLAWAIYPLATPVLGKLKLKLFRYAPVDAERRADGRDWPAEADTMVGLKRLENLRYCITDVIRNNVPGDLIEAGVWRGGASIFMRAVLKAYGEETRTLWVADSFEGLPKPDGRYEQDAGDEHWRFSGALGVSLEQVRANFARYGMLDEQVRFLPGWFKDTLPVAPIKQLSVLRLDGDMYASTMDALKGLYHKLSPGGYAIVDDYGNIATCRQAVDDFRAQNNITEELRQIDWSGAFWQKHP